MADTMNAAPFRHLFLTGPRGIGKSTVLRALISRCGIVYSGFETRPVLIGGQRRGFLMHGFVDLPPMEQDVMISVRIAERMSVPVLPAFERNGVRILQLSQTAPAPWILMDELGRMEAEAEQFREAVSQTLDCGKRVLGVLQQGSRLAEQLSARPDVRVVQVTEENRNALPEALSALLLASMV